MSTIGDLTPNMVGNVRVRTVYEEANIEGLLCGLDVETGEPERVRRQSGEVLRTTYMVSVEPTIGRIRLTDIPLDHPCEVLS